MRGWRANHPLLSFLVRGGGRGSEQAAAPRAGAKRVVAGAARRRCFEKRGRSQNRRLTDGGGGIRRLGRTIAINPGSDYGTGVLNGALITLERDKVAAHQLVRG